MSYELEELDGLTGDNENVAGTTQKAWFAPRSYFATIQALASLADATTAEEGATIDVLDPHVFEVGKGFVPIYITQGTGKATFTGPEDFDQSGGEFVFEGVCPGAKNKHAGLLRRICTEGGIFIFENRVGDKIQIGAHNIFAKCTFDWMSGGNTKERMGFTIKAKSEQIVPIYYLPDIEEIP